MKEPKWIMDGIVQTIHSMQIAEHGGANGVRDTGLLESALNRPRNIYHYEQGNIFTLAAAYAYGIIKNHPFFDGNKRTGYVLCLMFLELNGYTITAGKEDKYITFYKVAAGDMSEKDLIDWLKNNSAKTESS